MRKNDLIRYWHAFLHWKIWKAIGTGCVKAWRAAAGWSGWKKIFGLPFAVVVLLCVGCGGGLVWVFLKGMEQQIPAYVLYALSFYSLTALCVQLPAAIRGGKAWFSRHPKIAAMVTSEELKFSLELYVEQFINFAYGIFKIVSGVVIGSAWVGADGIYNFAQALIQLFQILRRKKPGTILDQWKSYRFCGGLVLLMHLTLTGIVFQMVNWGRVEENGEIMIIATAAFAFYKIVKSFLELARDRKHTHPIDSSVRMLELSQAIFAIFSLQASMFHTFGTGARWEHWMNLGTGCTVCLLVVSMGIYMIRRGIREIRTLQENEHGA